MKKTDFLKSIEAELNDRLHVLNTNDIDREIQQWNEAIRAHESSMRDALDFLKSIHIDHVGLTEEQYIAHCLRTCILGLKFTNSNSEQVGVICLIHNVLEISDVEEERIEKHFGKEILDGLITLKVDRDQQKDPEYLKAYYKGIADLNPYLKTVKVVDKLDNLYMLGLNPNDEVRERYLKEIQEYIVPFAAEIDSDLGELIEDLIVYNKKVGHFTKEIKL